MSQRVALIGSRAVAWHTDRTRPRLLHRSVHDWDLVSSCEVAQEWIKAHENDILDLEQCFEPILADDGVDFPEDYCPPKYRLRLRNGSLVEWELSDFFPSDALLLDSKFISPLPTEYKSKLYFSSSTSSKKPTVELCVPDLRVLVLLKFAHIFWRQSWRKTIMDLLAFREQFPALFPGGSVSAQNVIDSCESVEQREFCEKLYRLRVEETASRWHRHRLGQLEDPLLRGDVFGEFDLIESAAQKVEFIKRLVTKFALELFLDPILSQSDSLWLTDPTVTREKLRQECWLWALESVCTNGRVLIPLAPFRSGETAHLDPEHLIKISIYDSSPKDALDHLCSFRSLRKPVAHEKIQAALERYSGAFWDEIPFDQIGETFPHVNTKLISTVIEHLPEIYSPASSPAYCAEFDKLVGEILPPRPELPLELWQRVMIASDHLSVAALSQTSKFMYSAANERDARTWSSLAALCFNEERLGRARSLTGTQNGRDIFARALKLKWDSLAVRTFRCEHCGLDHESITQQEWHDYLTDPKKDWEFCQFAEFWCICPECTARSWSSCRQNTVQFI